MVLGILSYFLSIYLIDSTESIRNTVIKEQREKTKHENYIKEFSNEYESIMDSLEGYSEIVNVIWAALDNSETMDKYEKKYLNIKRNLSQLLTNHKSLIEKYESTFCF